MVHSLMRKPASAKTLSEEYGEPLGNLSYHLSKVLFERCGVVRIVATYQRRGAQEKVYGLKPDAYIGIIDWPTIPAHVRSGVHGIGLSSFLTAAIASIEAEPNNPEIPNIYSWQSVAVDQDGQREVVAAVEGLKTKVRSISARCATANPTNLVQIVVGSAAFGMVPGSMEENA